MMNATSIKNALKNTDPLKNLMQWYVHMGVDETIADQPFNRFADALTQSAQKKFPVAEAAPVKAHREKPTVADKRPLISARNTVGGEVETGIHNAVKLARNAHTVDELKQALNNFGDCSLKSTATNLVFMDGTVKARVMLIGDAPGAEEDRQGKPFVGPAGQLLNQMLSSIGYDRDDVVTTNIVFWRPPGNRTAALHEMALCMPFLERLVELIEPDVLVPLGGPAAKYILGKSEGIGRLHGQWNSYSTAQMAHPVDVLAMYHPDFLIKTPQQKRHAWADLLKLKHRLHGD